MLTPGVLERRLMRSGHDTEPPVALLDIGKVDKKANVVHVDATIDSVSVEPRPVFADLDRAVLAQMEVVHWVGFILAHQDLLRQAWLVV